jgi:hypothetical protein
MIRTQVRQQAGCVQGFRRGLDAQQTIRHQRVSLIQQDAEAGAGRQILQLALGMENQTG